MIFIAFSQYPVLGVIAVFTVFVGALINFSASVILSKTGMECWLSKEADREKYYQLKKENNNDEMLLLKKFKQGEYRYNQDKQAIYEQVVLRIKLLGLLVALPGMLYVLIMF